LNIQLSIISSAENIKEYKDETKHGKINYLKLTYIKKY